MKKFRLLALAFVLAALSGCARKTVVWETVDDSVDTEVLAPTQSSYVLHFDLPEDVQARQEDGNTCYVQEDGDYRIESRYLVADSADSAAHMLTGSSLRELGAIETSRCGLPEYRFAWYEQEDSELCQADLIVDGRSCYALIFSRKEDAAGSYDTTAGRIFASLCLDGDEGF